MLALIVIVVVAVVAAGASGGVYAYQQSLPTTASLSLKDGAREVGLDQALVVRFTRPVDAAAASAHIHVAPVIEGAFHPGTDGASVTFQPNQHWADLTRYQVSVDSFSDHGHTVKGARWSFTTTIVPRITSVTGPGGAGIAADASLPINTPLTLAFNTAMDTSATRITANGQPATVAWAGDGKSATVDTKGVAVGGLDLALAAGQDTAKHAADTSWKLHLNLVFKVTVHTTPLRAPALVQVPNDPSARDQSGLQSADMVFEYATEGGITRMTALYTNVPDKVGPVRSGRLISIKLTRHYAGMLFLSGVSEGTFGVLSRDYVPSFFDTQGFYYRSSDRLAPNNLYINGDAIARAEDGADLTRKSLPTTGSPALTGGSGAATVSVPDHNSSYAYDAGTATYTKVEDGHSFSDAAVGQPLRLSMVVVLRTRITVTGIIEDVNGARGLDYDIDGTGSADIYYRGAKYAAQWSSPNRNSPLVFTVDGKPVTLPAGPVWVDVVNG